MRTKFEFKLIFSMSQCNCYNKWEDKSKKGKTESTPSKKLLKF